MSIVQLLFSGGISLVLAYLLTLPLRAIGLRYGIVDIPTARSSHRKPTVRIGGPAIVLGTAAGLAVGWRFLAGGLVPAREVAALIGGGMIVAAASFADDLFGLKAQYRLFAHVLAAVLFVGLAGGLEWIDLPGNQRIMLGPLGLPLTIVWLIALTNIFNFMDGIDGLAAGVAAIVCLFVASAAYIAGNVPVVLYALILAGGAAGFLVHNFPPAKVFMGDAGSTFLGFTVGGISVIASRTDSPARAIPLLATCLMLGAFLFDTGITMLRRIARKDNLFQPHRDYLFQTAVEMGLTRKTVALSEYGLAMLLGVSSLCYLKLSPAGSWGLVLFWTAAFISLTKRLKAEEYRRSSTQTPDLAASGSRPDGRPASRNGGTVRPHRMAPLTRKLLILLVLMDICLCAASYFASFVANFVGFTPEFYEFMPTFRRTVWLVVPCRLCAFWVFGMYRGLFRRGRTQVLFDTLRSVAASTVLAALLIWAMTRFHYYPRAVLVIDALFAVYLVGLTRFVASMRQERLRRPAPLSPARLLIVGAGALGASAVREINSNPQLRYVAAGLVDDDPDKQDKRVHGVRVLGGVDRLHQLVREHEIDRVLIAIRFLSRNQLVHIMNRCSQAGIEPVIAPAPWESQEDITSVVQARAVGVSDLFGREPAEFDREAVSSLLTGKRVLVTGVSHQLGMELCRQIARLEPAALAVLDRDERAIYDAGSQLDPLATNGRLTTVVADMRDKEKVRRVFEEFRPEIVFHAAGSTNVPVAETNCDETVLNTIVGSRNVVECADRAGCERFIIVSSDKAANPVGILGCARRIGEILARQSRKKDMIAAAVRLGNVIEEPGNVISVFEKQVAAGGPVTVTHAEMTRRFIRARDAAQLLLVAAAKAKVGGLYCLGAEESVKVMDLAAEIVRLSGLRPHRDIKITVVGSRPGEKMCERPVGCNESRIATEHPRIFEIRSELVLDRDEFMSKVEELERFARANDLPGILRVMREIVPEFQPSQQFTEATDTHTAAKTG